MNKKVLRKDTQLPWISWLFSFNWLSYDIPALWRIVDNEMYLRSEDATVGQWTYHVSSCLVYVGIKKVQ